MAMYKPKAIKAKKVEINFSGWENYG